MTAASSSPFFDLMHNELLNSTYIFTNSTSSNLYLLTAQFAVDLALVWNGESRPSVVCAQYYITHAVQVNCILFRKGDYLLDFQTLLLTHSSQNIRPNVHLFYVTSRRANVHHTFVLR
jgi:hypothetical protein